MASNPMLELALGLPEQLAEAAVRARDVELGPLEAAGRRKPSFAGIVIAGMGGSAIGADLLRGLLADASVTPVFPCRDYRVPAVANERSLLVAISYSGDTEETIAAYRAARRRRCPAVVITSGGCLARMAHRARVPVVPVPGGLPPRAALGHLLASLLVTVERVGLSPSWRAALDEAVALLVARRGAWLRQATTLARNVAGNLPVVYSTARLLDAVADRWRCQLNENAKTLCHTNVLPEHNHNEIVGMGVPAYLARRSVLIGLFDPTTHPRTALRFRYALDITRGSYRRAFELHAEGRSALARVLSLVMIGDLLSVRLARERGVDPMPVERVAELKRRMARGRRG